MCPEGHVVKEVADRIPEIATPDQGIEDLTNAQEGEAIVVVGVTGDHHELLVVAVRRHPVVGAVRVVVDLAGERICAIEGIEIIAGIVVATAFRVGGVGQRTTLTVERRPRGDEQGGEIDREESTVGVDDVDLAERIPVEHVGLQEIGILLETT